MAAAPPVLGALPAVDEAFASEAEQAQLAEMRALLATELASQPDWPELTGDLRLLRFLRSRDNKAEVGAKAYREMLEWRAKTKMDARREQLVADMEGEAERAADDPYRLRALPHAERMSKYVSMDTHVANTQRGHFVLLDYAGGHDNEGLIKDVSKEDFEEWWISFMEKRAIAMDRASREEGRMLYVVQVLDMRDAGLHSVRPVAALQLIKNVIGSSLNNYPSSLGTMAIINAPSFFAGLFAMVSYMLTPRTLAKLHVFGTHQYAEHRAFLLEHVSPAVLHRLETASERRGAAEAYTEERQDVPVPARSSARASVPVVRGTRVSWTWSLKAGNVDFSVLLHTRLGESVVTKEARVEHEGEAPEEGEYTYDGEEGGMLTLVWDNSFSWMTAKSVGYCVSVAAPAEM